MDCWYADQSFHGSPHMSCRTQADIQPTPCPVPPIPDLLYPDSYPCAVIQPSYRYFSPPSHGNGIYVQSFLEENGTLSFGGCYSPLQPYPCFTQMSMKPRKKAPGPKRGPGRPRGSGSSRGIAKRKYKMRQKESSDKAELGNNSDARGDAPIATRGKRRGRKPGSKSRPKGENEVKKTRKRRSSGRLSSKPTHDIVQLTENLVDMLLSPSDKPRNPEIDSALVYQDHSSLSGLVDELNGRGPSFEQEDIRIFNELVDELAAIGGDVDSRTASTVCRPECSKNFAQPKLAENSGNIPASCKMPPSDCQQRRTGEHRRSVLDSDKPSEVPMPSSDTWKSKVGGNCANKWQLFQKHVLGNSIIKQMREERQTERLIKVLCSTPQRTLRSHPQEGDDSFLDSSATSSEAVSLEKSTSSWYSAPDSNLNVSWEEVDPRTTPHSVDYADVPLGYFAVDGGICPDCEPTLRILDSPAMAEVRTAAMTEIRTNVTHSIYAVTSHAEEEQACEHR